MKMGLKVLIFIICAVLLFHLVYPHLDGDLRLWIDHPKVFQQIISKVLNS